MLWTPDTTIKPPPGTPIDVESSLLDKLYLWMPLNEGTGAPNDLAPGGLRASYPGTAPTWVPTRDGPGLYCTGGNSFTQAYRSNMVTGDFTLHIRFRPITWPGTYTCLCDKGSGSIREIALFFNTSGNLQYWAFGEAGAADADLGGGFTAGTVWNLTVTRQGDQYTFLKDGTYWYTPVRTATTGTVADIPLYFGGNVTGGGTNSNAEYMLVAFWKGRALSRTEIRSLVDTPYALHSPSSLRWINMSLTTGGGGGFSTWYAGAGGHGAMLGGGIMGG